MRENRPSGPAPRYLQLRHDNRNDRPSRPRHP
jgi:hypothetical protein